MTLPPMGIARPELLGLLLIVPLLAALVILAAIARRRALRMFSGTVGLSTRSAGRMWVKSALLLLAVLSLTIALAGPYVDLRSRGARRLGVDIVLAVDVSQSMATRDVAPDRLRAARHLAQDLGERMVGSRVSLVLFAGQGTVRYPATTDPKILGEVLDNSGKVARLQQGSSFAAAVESALAAFPVESGPSRGRAIVLVSDGEVTLGSAPDVATLVERNVKLHTVGIGTPQGGQIPTYDTNNGTFTGYLRGPDGAAIVSRLDERGLRALAAAAGGQYWRYTGDDRVVGELASTLRTLETVEGVENAGTVPDERSRAFVALAVALVLLERLLPDRRRMPAPRDAAGPRDAAVPRRPGRRRVLGVVIGSGLLVAACGPSSPSLDTANGHFAAGRYREALALYRDVQADLPDSPELAINAGNALHMSGDHGRALTDYAHAIDVAGPDLRAIAQYDRGNTLFRLGRLEDARDAYREALRLDPGDRDAKFNLELLQRQLDEREAGRRPQPGPSGPPSASGPPGGPGGPGASGPASSLQPGENTDPPSDQQGDPTDDRAPGDPGPGDLRASLEEFRQAFTFDQALQVLDALRGQQRGIEQLIEGPRRSGGVAPEY